MKSIARACRIDSSVIFRLMLYKTISNNHQRII